MLRDKVRIATRKSPLALWQANYIGKRLIQHWPDLEIELLPLVTSGDKFLHDKLLTIGGKGLFVKELEEALLDKRADIAVHSMKDVPANIPSTCLLAAINERHNPFDALVSPKFSSLATLPKGSIVGTSSLRRQSQLLAIRPDLTIKTLRGNVQTRLDKLHNQEFNAIILATAGLQRLNLAHHITQILSADMMLPACGQGALGIECRADDKNIISLLAPLNHVDTALCVNTERAINAALGGHCHTPIAIYCCILEDNTLSLRVKVASTDGKIVISQLQQGPQDQVVSLITACIVGLQNSGVHDLLDSTS